jgi:MFS family permease
LSQRYAATLAASCAAVMTGQLANTLPSSLNGVFAADFHATGSQLTWISAAFLIPLVVFELTFGVLGDRYGRRRLLVAGCALLAGCGVICAAAPDVEVMWAGLALGGLGTGILFPTSLAMSAAVARSNRDRARIVAIWAGFLSAGAAVSSILAGALAQYASWRWAYLIVAAASAGALAVATRAADSSAPAGRRLDAPGQVTFAAGLIALVYAAVQGSASGWGSPVIVAAFAAGAVLLVAFAVVEARSAAPLLPLGLLANRSFAVASLVTLAGMFGFLACCYSMSMWLGAVQHVSALRVGLVFLVVQAPAFAGIPLVSRLLRSRSPRWPLAAGFAFIAACGFLCADFGVRAAGWTWFLLPAAFAGVGFALTIGSVTAASVLTVPPPLAGMASASTNLLRDLGFTLGPVIVNAVALNAAGGWSAGPAALGAGYSLAFRIAAFAAVGAALAACAGLPFRAVTLADAPSGHASPAAPAVRP